MTKYVVMTPIVIDGKVRKVGHRFTADDDPQIQMWRRSGVILTIPEKQPKKDGDD